MGAGSGFTTELKLVISVCGIYGSYLLYGLLQEGIYKFEDKDGNHFDFTLSLLAVQCIANVLGAVVGQALIGTPPAKDLPPSALLKPAASFIGAMFCSNQALRYVSYPVQALAKSCKMVPVIAFQRLWFKKVYALRDYVMVALVTLGIIVFQDSKTGGQNTAFGLLLLFASLCLDGITGPYQENVQKVHGANGHQVMFWCNFWAFVFLGIAIVANGEYTESIPYLMNPDNVELQQQIVLFTVVSALGQNFIFMTLENFDALILTTVTTTRKCFTVAVSIMYYGHLLSMRQYVGIGLTTAGLVIEVYGKYAKQQEKKAAKAKST